MAFEWTDILWHILALPIYQTIGTVLHELCHAIAAKREGFVIKKFQWYPCWVNGNFYWGYVRWDYPNQLPMVDGYFQVPKATVSMYMAPYYLSMVKVVIGSVLALLIKLDVIACPTVHVWVAGVVLLLVSPVVEYSYQLWKLKTGRPGDLAEAEKLRKL